ncbi:YeiH family protein [Clostridium aminobutyricum]|uniref:YeiH family putative sulfate export transporter n=1 Tax=Clostridium aminobutyricum TaxID=33953 RepID=A0A939D6Q4_CLOAM|nr:YeiH family protein [Clostridium aminobutyricum]MBN7772085.1 YeiH family putative sulfate export transporter [Clostridium aminobutyricum]
MKSIKKSSVGILLCTGIAIPATLLGKHLPIIGGPGFAILIGMMVAPVLKSKQIFQLGISFASTKILQSAIILLGFGLNLSVIFTIGKQSLPIILSTIAVSLIVAHMLYRLLAIDSTISTLIGVGSSICGGSAIAATAPVIGATEEQIAQSISVVFLFNVIAALLFPTLGGILGMSTEGFGLFTGTAINDTSSVTAAACAWDELHQSNALDIATIVKLTRTLAILPITICLACWRAKKEKTSDSSIRLFTIFPRFILYFLMASVLTTVFQLSAEATALIKEISKFFIVIAMSAIGLNTNVIKLIRTGGKPILLGLCCWVCISAVSLGMQKLLGMW